MERTGIFVGSFDPFTTGHHAIVRRALPLFDRIVIGVGFNEQTVRAVPQEYILAETDDADAGIESVLASLTAIRGEDMTPAVAANSARFLGGVTQTGRP